MKKYLFSILFNLLLGNFVFSQTTNLGEPLLLKSKIHPTQSFYRTPSVDNALELKSSQNDLTKVRYFGKEFNVSIDVLELAEKTVLPSGDILYQYGIECKNALSINLQFDQFYLPEGATLYLVDPIHRKFDGAYTHFNNNKASMLGTEILKSDKVIIEVVIPADKQQLAKLNLGLIVHGYKSIESMLKSLNSSGTCEIDVNCPLGLGWENQRNSVALMIMGGSTCTGSLVNNTSGTIIPYFLSANHCGTSPGAWVFRFKWESPENQVDCGTAAPSVDGPTNMTVNGGTLCSNYSASDFTLTLLNQAPDPSWDIYYNGWDRTDVPATQLTVIHHPAGDIKKISRDNSSAVSASFNGGAADSHWQAPSWDYGATEGGSSGSPLYNQDHRTIGQLHGGNSDCGASPSNMTDEFGKFYVSWDGGGTDLTRLSNWLDPGNIAPDFIDGVNPAIPSLTVDGGIGNVTIEKSTLCGGNLTTHLQIYNAGIDTIFTADIQYSFDNGTSLIYHWSDTLTSNHSAPITLPTVTLSGGNHSVKCIFINTTKTDLNPKNDTVLKTFKTIDNGIILKLNMTIFCDANENSWKLIDENQQVVASGGPFANITPNIIKDSVCITPACYTFKLFDTYGDGIVGYGNGCESGFYKLMNSDSTIISQLTQDSAAFGFTYSSTFCAKIEETLTADGLTIYPNPSNSFITINSSDIQIKTLEITSITGQRVYYEDEINLHSKKINVSNYSKGIYYLKISSNNEIVVKSLVVN